METAEIYKLSNFVALIPLPLSFSLQTPEVIFRILDDKDVFALHLWNELSSRLTEAEVDVGSAFYSLARDNCPNTFRGELQRSEAPSTAS